MSRTTVTARDSRLAGCCAVPNPRAGEPHVALWVADAREGRFLPALLDPEAADRLGQALVDAAALTRAEDLPVPPSQLTLPQEEAP